MALPTIAFQGERGSFSEEAAYKLLGGKMRIRPCETFAATFRSVANGKGKYCLVPIENTLAGSVYENYDLLLENDLHIVGEVNLRIVHNLIAFPGVTLKTHTIKVTLPANAPLGNQDVRIITKAGISNPRAFVVGDRKEFVETEPNNDEPQANRIELNSTVNGTIMLVQHP